MLIGTAVICVRTLRNKKQYVLLGQRANEIGYGLWCNLGGKPESGEHTDDALLREVKEESGLVLAKQDIRPVHFAHIQEPEREFVVLYYENFEEVSFLPELSFPSSEFLDMQWFDTAGRDIDAALSNMWRHDCAALYKVLASPRHQPR